MPSYYTYVDSYILSMHLRGPYSNYVQRTHSTRKPMVDIYLPCYSFRRNIQAHCIRLVLQIDEYFYHFVIDVDSAALPGVHHRLPNYKTFQSVFNSNKIDDKKNYFLSCNMTMECDLVLSIDCDIYIVCQFAVDLS